MSLDYENWRGRVRVTRLLPHVWLVRCHSNPNAHHEADKATRIIIAATERTAVRDGIETLSEIYRSQTMQRRSSWTVEFNHRARLHHRRLRQRRDGAGRHRTHRLRGLRPRHRNRPSSNRSKPPAT